MKKSDINILIVDDDKAIGKTLSEAVVRAGYKAFVANRADDALNLAKLKLIHAAVIDCMLPLMNGVTLGEELRKTRFDNGVIVLISGIFRDKAFEAEAVQKTRALAYLQKPFGVNDLLGVLKPALEELVEDQHWSLQTILVKNLNKTRERVKVVEHLEEIRGVETAFVLSILMDAGVSGFLNIVSEAGGIYGIGLQNGKIVTVDSDEGDEVVVRYLIDTGYLTKQDWDEFASGESRKAPLQKLVAAGYISPHAALQAKRDQIVFDLKRILRFEKVNINFVPDQGASGDLDGLGLGDLFADLNESIDVLLDMDYLKKFFQSTMASAIRKLETYSKDNPVWGIPLVDRVKSQLKSIDENIVLEKLLAQNTAFEAAILKAIYFLVIFRQVLFADAAATRNFETEAARRKKVFNDLKGKDPFQIFAYFGTSEDARNSEVESVFREFVKTNHPDRLPPEAPPALRDVTNSIFALVSGAYDTLINPAKRNAYQGQVLAQIAEKELQAEAMAGEGLELIRRGAYGKAVEKFKSVLELGPNEKIYCLYVWARVKQNPRGIPKAELVEIQRKMDEIPNAERSNHYYHMALGLLRVASGDVNAVHSFEKALSFNPSFVEARREINALQSTKEPASAASDLLTGDLTQIVSQIFKRKAK